jgi:catalase-peroxidase
MDPLYAPISKRFHENPAEFADAFARAWFKLTHRDMGPITCYLGKEVPSETLIWQDPVPKLNHELINLEDITQLKDALIKSNLTIPQLVATAWGSAATFRNSDKRGGANGGRIALVPQNTWEVNQPQELKGVLKILSEIQQAFNQRQVGNKKISLADIIVLGGAAGIEAAALKAGEKITVPFTPGRTDALQDQTDIESFSVLEPKADGFRNFNKKGNDRAPEELLLDKAHLLTLTAPEMTVLIGGMRVLNTNVGKAPHGVFTNNPETLSNDFFINLLDMSTQWGKSDTSDTIFEGRDRDTGEVRWTATSVDLAFGSNSQLRAIAEVYACKDAQKQFIQDFVAVWIKVMNLDRFELT